MARPALTDEQRREIRRRIRKAASELYAENGLADISARSIAKRAGVSVGSIYSHFSSLAELMQSLWREPVARLLTRLEKAAEITDPVARLRAMLDTYVAFGQEERSVYRGAFLYVRPDTHEKPRKIELAGNDMMALITAAIEEGQQAGSIRPGDPLQFAELLWAGLHGALALPINIDRIAFPDPPGMQRHMVELLMEWMTV